MAEKYNRREFIRDLRDTSAYGLVIYLGFFKEGEKEPSPVNLATDFQSGPGTGSVEPTPPVRLAADFEATVGGRAELTIIPAKTPSPATAPNVYA